jgi:hypothetical protein
MRNFDSLSEREILALAISLEEEDERVYAEYAEGLRQNFPASAEVFDGMRRGGIRTSPPLDRAIPQEIRRTHPVDPPPGRARVRASQSSVADAAAGSGYRPQSSQRHGGGEPALLREGRRARARCGRSPIAGRPGAGRAHARRSRRGTGEDQAAAGREAPQRTKPTGVCSCCRSCSPAWLG